MRSNLKILGVWDLETVPITLGGLLFLVEELHAQAVIHQAEIRGICFVGDVQLSMFGGSPQKARVLELDSGGVNSPVLSAIFGLQGVAKCYQVRDIKTLKAFASSDELLWPSLEAINEQGHISLNNYGSTLFLQRYYREHGDIPSLSVKDWLKQRVLDSIRDWITPSLPVAVHLKNISGQQGSSNANLEEWSKFFLTCWERFYVKFILLGDDEVDKHILNLPNIIRSRELGWTLAEDLALIQTSYLFMGMASGLCNMAIFNKNPYIIYKNPYHHREVMLRELGDEDHFPFATRFQKFYRVFENSQNLNSEFERIYWSKQTGYLGSSLLKSGRYKV